jgi:tetratricopeptide (TPR) repeat protein
MQIFVSHSSIDKALCDQLVATLRRAGANMWYDEHNLGAGLLLEEIQHEAQTRHVFSVLLSKAAFASKWVRRETTWAFNLYDREPNRLLVPVTVEQIEPSDFTGPWLFLEGFKRVEAPAFQPYVASEMIANTLRLLALTSTGETQIAVAPQLVESLDDLLIRGKALLAQEKYVEALSFFERATQLDTKDFSAWFNLGLTYSRLQQWENGITAYDRAIHLNPQRARAWNNKGWDLANLRRFSEALDAVEQSLLLNPNSGASWDTKGFALHSLGSHQKALDAYKRALAIKPTAIRWIHLAETLRALGQVSEAREGRTPSEGIGQIASCPCRFHPSSARLPPLVAATSARKRPLSFTMRRWVG